MRFLNIILFGLLAFFVFKMFFSPRGVNLSNSSDARVDFSGQEFKAPVSKLETKPLFKEVDFDDSEKVGEAKEVMVYTKNCDYQFSTHGGVLSGVEFKNYTGETGNPIRTVYPTDFDDRERGSFLIALDEKTPFVYSLSDQGQNEDGAQWVEFKAENKDCRIKKTFIIPENGYTLGLRCSFEPKRGSSVTPRIVFSGPRIGSLTDDKSDGLVLGVDGKNIAQIGKDQEGESGWKLPQIFGAQDKYFMHAMYAVNVDEFVKRAYVKRVSEKDISCFVECQEISEATTADFKFYVGPKSVSALRAADPRLVGTLSFGWLDWLCDKLVELIEWLKKRLGNYGLAIMCVALLTRFVLIPLSFFARRRFSDIIEFEREHAQEISTINRQYKDNFVKKSEELAKFYERYGKSQSQKLTKMLPLLFELPVIFASYKILNNYISFYHAPFFLWVKDLSAKDPFFLLPILFGLSFVLRERISRDPAQKDMKFIKFFMPIILVAFFANLPSGLVLYMFFNSFFSSIEELVLDGAIRRFGLGRA